MIFRTVAKSSWKQAQIRCNTAGAFVCLKWTQWSSSGAPVYDPVTGAQLTDAAYLMQPGGPGIAPSPLTQLNPDGTWANLVTTPSGTVPTQSFCRTRCFTHFIGPTQSRARIFAEIKEGDCIVDFVVPLVQIAAPGNTSFYVGQIVDIFTLGAANRALAPGGILPAGVAAATTMPGNVKVESLQNPAVWIYRSKWDWENDVNGEEWIQQSIGKDLAQSWATIYGGELLGEAMLLRKAT